MGDPQAALGHGLMRDNYGPRALETLVRDRGTVPAELFRALAALKALQAELHDRPGADGAWVGRASDLPFADRPPRSDRPHNQTNPRNDPRTTA